MVQIGNFHIGLAGTAKAPVLNYGEAYILWNHLTSRYDCIEKSHIYQSLAHDPEFKYMIGNNIGNILENEANELEKLLNTFKLPFPSRPPKSVNIDTNTQIMNDRLIFRDIFAGCENFLDMQLHAVRIFIMNDPLRKMFVGFLNRELEAYDDLCKYGKVKGWLEVPPIQ